MTTAESGRLTGQYTLDTAQSRIGFTTRQTLAKVRGHFDEYDGRVNLDGADPANSRARLAISAGSIQTGNRRRDAHLRLAYLDTSTHPHIEFVSTGIEQIQPARFRLVGDLSIRGATHPVTVDLRLIDVGDGEEPVLRACFRGEATLRRSRWGVRWNRLLEGGGTLVADKVTIEIDVVLVRTPHLADQQ